MVHIANPNYPTIRHQSRYDVSQPVEDFLVLRLVLFVILTGMAVAGCAVPNDPQVRYDLVKVGMTLRQVEQYFGPIEFTVLEYAAEQSRYVFDSDRLIAMSQILEKGESAKGFRVKSGMTRAQVISILGSPTSDCAKYPAADSGDYSFCFANGKIVSKEIEPPRIPPIPGHPLRR